MNAKQKESIREAVTFVEAYYPPGTLLRYSEDGELYMIGTRQKDQFWMMSATRAEKGLIGAMTISQDFKPENPARL